MVERKRWRERRQRMRWRRRRINGTLWATASVWEGRAKQTRVEGAADVRALACVSHGYTPRGRRPVCCYQLLHHHHHRLVFTAQLSLRTADLKKIENRRLDLASRWFVYCTVNCASPREVFLLLLSSSAWSCLTLCISGRHSAKIICVALKHQTWSQHYDSSGKPSGLKISGTFF